MNGLTEVRLTGYSRLDPCGIRCEGGLSRQPLRVRCHEFQQFDCDAVGRLKLHSFLPPRFGGDRQDEAQPGPFQTTGFGFYLRDDQGQHDPGGLLSTEERSGRRVPLA